MTTRNTFRCHPVLVKLSNHHKCAKQRPTPVTTVPANSYCERAVGRTRTGGRCRRSHAVTATFITPMDVFHSQLCTRRCSQNGFCGFRDANTNAKGKLSAHATANVYVHLAFIYITKYVVRLCHSIKRRVSFINTQSQ